MSMEPVTIRDLVNAHDLSPDLRPCYGIVQMMLTQVAYSATQGHCSVQPGLFQRKMSGSMVIQQPGSVMMSVAQVDIKGHDTGAQVLGHQLWPRWQLRGCDNLSVLNCLQ